MIIKLVDELKGEHIHSKVYMSKESNQTFALCGELVMRVDEWRSFGTALLLGASRMNGRLQIEIPNDKVITNELRERDV